MTSARSRFHSYIRTKSHASMSNLCARLLMLPVITDGIPAVKPALRHFSATRGMPLTVCKPCVISSPTRCDSYEHPAR